MNKIKLEINDEELEKLLKIVGDYLYKLKQEMNDVVKIGDIDGFNDLFYRYLEIHSIYSEMIYLGNNTYGNK